MNILARKAADLASAAAQLLDQALEKEQGSSSRTAMRTTRDQMLEAAYHLAAGNVPVKVANGWLVRSKSLYDAHVVRLKMGQYELTPLDDRFLLTQGNFTFPLCGPLVAELEIAGGKTYLVSPDCLHCTCERGSHPGQTCEHMVRCEYYAEACRMMKPNTIGARHVRNARQRSGSYPLQNRQGVANPARRSRSLVPA